MNYPVIPRTFFSGDCFDAYRILGAHPCTDSNGAEGWRFAVWAPGATAVEVCGGFDGWERGVPMEKADTGVWSAFIPGLAEGDLYKYRVHGADGSTVMRSDPYAFATELRPGTASKLTKLDFTFDDTAWMERRDKCRNRPLNIYELHAGSWKHKPGATRPDGSEQQLAVYDGKCRAWMEGIYDSLPDTAEKRAEECSLPVKIDRRADGTVSVGTQSLVPWDTDYGKLEIMADVYLNYLAQVFNLPDDDYVKTKLEFGSESSTHDELMTAEEREIVK